MSGEERFDRRHFLTAVDLTVHFMLALGLAGFFYWLTSGWVWPVLGFIGGILIDVDHFIDYFLYYGLRFNLYDFLGHRYLASGRCYIVLHSWEIIGLMWLFSVAVLWLTPIAAGMTIHILTDYLFRYHSGLLSLSLLYRRHHGFRLLNSP